MFVGVDAQRHDQGIHVSVGDASECSVECRHPTLHGRSGGKWQVQVPVLAVALTDLARMAREPGKLEDGVRMDRDEKHIAAFGENGLRAVAMVIVDVEDRDTWRATVEESLRCDGGVVEIAVATKLVGGRMVARRSAQPVRRVAVLQHQVGAGHGDCRGLSNSPPSAGCDRAVRGEAVISELTDEVVGACGAHSSSRPREPHRGRA